MDKDGYYISYSPCGVFSEFVGEKKPGYRPCVKASVRTIIIMHKI